MQAQTIPNGINRVDADLIHHIQRKVQYFLIFIGFILLTLMFGGICLVILA
jgi:hypothetical protein